MTTAPRWEKKLDHAAVALAARMGGGVALLLEDGKLDAFGETGEPTAHAKLAPGRRVDHGDVQTRAYPAKVHPHQAGWVAAVPGETSLQHLLDHAGAKSARLAAGGEPVEHFALAGEQLSIARFGSLELWTTADQCRWRVAGGPYVATALVGRTIVGLRADGELVFASSLKGNVIGTLKLAVPEPAFTWHLATIDASRMALGLGEWLVVVEAASQKVLRRTRVRGPIASLVASEKRVVAGLHDGWIQVFDAFTGEARGALQAHQEAVIGVATDGKTVYSACRSGPLRAWDGAALETSARAAAPVTAIASRGVLAASGDRAGRVRLLKGVEEVGTIRLDGPISGVFIGRDESALVSAGSVLVRLKKPWKTPEPILLNAAACALAADDAYAFTGSEQGTVDVYDLARGMHVTSYALSDAGITGLLRLPGATLVAGTSALDGRLFVVDVAEAKVVFRIDAHQEAFGVTSLAADPRGRIVASGSDDGTVALIDPNKGRVLARIRLPETPVSLAFDATGKKLAAVLADGSTIVAALDQKAALSKLELPAASRAAWGDALLVGLADGRVERAPPTSTPTQASR